MAVFLCGARGRSPLRRTAGSRRLHPAARRGRGIRTAPRVAHCQHRARDVAARLGVDVLGRRHRIKARARPLSDLPRDQGGARELVVRHRVTAHAAPRSLLEDERPRAARVRRSLLPPRSARARPPLARERRWVRARRPLPLRRRVRDRQARSRGVSADRQLRGDALADRERRARAVPVPEPHADHRWHAPALLFTERQLLRGREARRPLHARVRARGARTPGRLRRPRAMRFCASPRAPARPRARAWQQVRRADRRPGGAIVGAVRRREGSRAAGGLPDRDGELSRR